MLNDKPDDVSSQDELTCIRDCLMEKGYSQLNSVPCVLRLIQDMLAESHPSGYPDPNTLAMVARLLREEKFKDRREKQAHTPLSADIQLLIDRLKKLKIQAMRARPEEITRSTWGSRPWDSRDATIPFPISPILYLLLYFILLITVHFIDLSDSAKVFILMAYFISSAGIAILIKSVNLLITIFISLLVAYIWYFHPFLTCFDKGFISP